jgi:hypothetical protein
MEILNQISSALLPGVVIFFIASSIILYQKEKIYMSPSSEWVDVKKHPIPKDIRCFLGTDGKKVEYFYTVQWGPYGEIIFNNYEKTYLTHWQAMPCPPENKGK